MLRRDFTPPVPETFVKEAKALLDALVPE